MDETNPGSNKDPSGKDLINAIDCYLSNSFYSWQSIAFNGV